MPTQSNVISSVILASINKNKKGIKSNGEVNGLKFTSVFSNIMESDVEFESSPTYSNTILTNLKSKYIVLCARGTSNNSDKNSDVKLNEKSDIVIKKVKEECALPTPKKVLFPLEAVQVGWRGSVPVGSGLMNLGNTCYLNSTLQALFHVPAFVNWIQNDLNHSSKCESLNGMTHSECLICAMAKTLKQSHSFTGSSMKPIQIYSKLKLICKHLVHGHQEDAHEFLRYLMEGMERSYLTIFNCTKLDSYSKETTPLNQIFGGYMRTEVTCLVCHHISTTFQHFQDLLLDIRTACSVEDALETYFSRERLGDGDQAYYCEHCKRRVAASKKFSLERPPKALCIQLKRFSAMGGKNNKQIGVKQYLDLSRFKYKGNSLQFLRYKLVSLITHLGSSSSCGHYTAVGLTASGSYYLYDDSSVKPVSLGSVLNTNAYILMYEQDIPIKPATPSKVPISLNGFGAKVDERKEESPSKPHLTPKTGASIANSPSGSTAPVSEVISSSSATTSPSSSKVPQSSKPSFTPPKPTSASCPAFTLTTDPVQESPSKPSSISPGVNKPAVQATERESPKNESGCKKPYEDKDKKTSNSHSSPKRSLVPYLSESSDSELDGASHNPNKHSDHSDHLQGSKVQSAQVSSKNSIPIDEKQSGPNNTIKVNSFSNVTKSPAKGANHKGNHENASKKVTMEIDVKGRTWEVTPVREEKAECPSGIGTSGRWSVTSNDKPSRDKTISSANRSQDDANSNVVDSLMKFSNRGYGGSNVSSWSGSKSELDKEVEKEKSNLKRSRNSYDDEYDRGKSKKVRKFESFRHESRGHNRFQAMQNRKNSWPRSNFYRHYTAIDRQKTSYYRNNQYNRWH